MSFFSRMGDRIRRFMYGRYGYDKLSSHMLFAAILFYLLSLFIFGGVFFAVYALLVVFSLLRTLSRNTVKRYKELNAYNKLLGKISGFFKLLKCRWRDRKTHRYFKCKCHATLRVPKGKGKITVHCPKCGRSIEKRT